MKKGILLAAAAIAMILMGIASASASAYSVSITKTYNGDYGYDHDIPYSPQQFRLWFAEESMNLHDWFQTDHDQFDLVSPTVTANGSTFPSPVRSGSWVPGLSA